MTAKLAALQRLHDAVAKGYGSDQATWHDAFGRMWHWGMMADSGSLGAAKALHEALLPGWVARPQIGGKGAGVTVWHCTIEDWDSGDEISADNQPDPARAWLLAIFKALMAQEGE